MSSLEKSTTNTGYIVGSKDGELLRVDTDTHLISIARTGGGKGKTVAIPNLLDHEGSVLSLEIDGETLLATEFYRRNILKQQIRILDPFHASDAPERDSINILDTLDPSSPLFSADAKIVAKSIVKTDSGAESPDPYWTNKSVELLASLIIYAKIDPRVADEDRNLSFLASIISSFGSEEWEMHMLRLTSDTSIFKSMLKGAGSYFYNSSGPIINSNTSSIISVLSGYMDFARDPQIQRYSDHSTFALNELAEGNTTVYIVMPSVDYFTAFNTWVRLLVERTIAVVPSRTGKKHLIRKENRILFMLDEFTQLGKLDGVDQGMQTCRHKGITLWLLFQDLSRLRLVYGNEVAESFLGAASCIQAFEITERETTKYLSERAGKKVLYIANRSTSISEADSYIKNDSLANTLSNSSSSAERRGMMQGHNTSRSATDAHYGEQLNTSHASGTSGQYSEDSTMTSGNAKSITAQISLGRSYSQTKNLGIAYQGHIVPALEPTEITRLTSSRAFQILCFDDGEVLIAERADWLSLPQLRERVEGPVAAPQLPNLPCIPLDLEDLPKNLVLIGDKVATLSHAINLASSKVSRTNALYKPDRLGVDIKRGDYRSFPVAKEHPFDGSHFIKPSSIDELIDICIIEGPYRTVVRGPYGLDSFEQNEYFWWFDDLVNRVANDDNYIDLHYKLAHNYVVSFNELAKGVEDKSLLGLARSILVELQQLSGHKPSLMSFIEQLRSSILCIKEYPRKLENYCDLRNYFRQGSSALNLSDTLSEICDVTHRISRSFLSDLTDLTGLADFAETHLILGARRLRDLLHEGCADFSDFETWPSRGDWSWRPLKECSTLLSSEPGINTEQAINNFIKSLKDAHEAAHRFRKFSGSHLNYSVIPEWDVASQKNNLNQEMNKDFASYNERRESRKPGTGWMYRQEYPRSRYLYSELSKCSRWAAQVCHELNILKEVFNLVFLGLIKEYSSSFCAISTLLGEIESELLIFSESPIWERLREQEEADLIKNSRTDTRFIPKLISFLDLDSI